MSNVKIVALINPPITTVANGFCVSEPMPCESAAGSNPIAAIVAVMTTGRIRDMTPAFTESDARRNSKDRSGNMKRKNSSHQSEWNID
jgi:proline racemase